MNEPVLSVKELCKNFGSNKVLKGINFDVYPGQIIGYIGPNGAGKSTTIKIFLGIIEQYQGGIEIFGRELKAGDWEYKRRIGYVPEQSEIYENLTAFEYLTFIGEMYGMESGLVEENGLGLMKLFGIEKSYHTRISSYSKGIRQKLLIISAMIHDPDILFLDEPLSGLDANSVMVFKEILSMLRKKGKTIFYSSHIMEIVEKISDRIMLLYDGLIVADSTFEDLQAQNENDSLQDIFNQLTGFNDHNDIASQFVKILERRSS